jgi:hypothetical protein
MHNIEEDIVPQELIDQAIAMSNLSTLYKVYFDKDTGDILSITNEENLNYTNSIDVEYAIVKDLLTGKKQLSNFKIAFSETATPEIVSKITGDTSFSAIEEVPIVDNWNSVFTIENYPLLKQWGFQLRPDQRVILQRYNLNTIFDVFVVDADNYNFLIRSIKISLKDIIEKDRVYITHDSNKESETDNKIFMRKFFASTGYQNLYDTNS